MLWCPWGNNGLYSRDPQPLGPQASTGLQPVRNWVAQQEVSNRWESAATIVFIALPWLTLLHYHNAIIIEIRCTINESSRNYPHQSPPQSVEKLSSTKPVPNTRRAGDCWYTVWGNLLLKEGRRQWHPTPVLLPGKSHGWRSLVGCSPWGC